MCCKIENSNLLCSQRYMKKLVFGFRRLLFDVEKGACFLVFDASFSMSKTSFGFRNHFLYRLVGERCVEKQKRFLVFGFRRPDWTDLIVSEKRNIFFRYSVMIFRIFRDGVGAGA